MIDKNRMIEVVPKNNQPIYFEDDDIVCYCFTYTKKDILEDFQVNGYSTILEKIQAEKKSNSCRCEVQNPRKR